MTKTAKQLLKFITSNPGLTISEITEQLDLARSTIYDKVKDLIDSKAIMKVSNAFIANPNQEFCNEQQDDPRTRLAKHCANRFQVDLFEKFSNQDKDLAPGYFDINSIIHAAVTTDSQLRILDWSRRFRELVKETRPELLTSLDEKQLKYVAPPGEESWLGSLGAKKFDWNSGSVELDSDAFGGPNEIWAQMLETGVVDGYAFRARDIDGNPIYLEFYIAPQRGFLGFQSIMMNVNDRVIAMQEQNIKDAHYDFFHHHFRNPLQRLEILAETIALQSETNPGAEEMAQWQQSILSTSKTLAGILQEFPGDVSTTKVFVPVIQQLRRAARFIRNREKNLKEKGAEFQYGDVRIASEATLNHDCLVETIPSLQYGALYSFIDNAVTHGRSAKGVEVSFEVKQNGSSKNAFLEILIADFGAEVASDFVEYWNQQAQDVRDANVSDIAQKSGLKLALMGIRTGGGETSFRYTNEDNKTGLTVQVRLPIKQAQDAEPGD